MRSLGRCPAPRLERGWLGGSVGLLVAVIAGTQVTFSCIWMEPKTPATLVAAPVSQDFGAITVGRSSQAISLLATNTGVVNTGSLAVTLLGATGGDFAITSDACSGVTLSGGGECLVAVAFKPSQVGSETATLTISATPGGTVSIALTGTGN